VTSEEQRREKGGLESWHLNSGDKEGSVSHEMMGRLNPILPEPGNFWWWDSNGFAGQEYRLVKDSLSAHRKRGDPRTHCSQ
jgi:hypothetical protein